MAGLSPDFKDFLSLLNKNGARYLVVGGYAMAFHGRPRYTKDIDVWLESTAANAKMAARTLEEFGFGSLGLKAEDFLEPGTVIQLGREPNRIDILTSLSGLTFEECYPSRCQIQLDGVELPFLDKCSLQKNKRAVGRPQDLVDADALDGTQDG